MKVEVALIAFFFAVGTAVAGNSTCNLSATGPEDETASLEAKPNELVSGVLNQYREVRLTLQGVVDELGNLSAPESSDSAQVTRGQIVAHLRWEIDRGKCPGDREGQLTNRQLAYFLLTRISAGNLTGAVDQFLEGLNDEDFLVREPSARGLSAAPEQRRPAVGLALIERLEVEADDRVTPELLVSLTKVASPALKDRLSVVQETYENPEALAANRGRAALILIGVLGTPAAVEVFRAADTTGEREALKSLAVVGRETNGGFSTNMEGVEKVRRFAWEKLSDADTETRKVVVQQLFMLCLGPDRSADSDPQLSVNKEALRRATAAREVEQDSEVRDLLDSRISMVRESGELLTREELRR